MIYGSLGSMRVVVCEKIHLECIGFIKVNWDVINIGMLDKFSNSQNYAENKTSLHALINERGRLVATAVDSS